MNAIELQAQRELDTEILNYVRGMVSLAPVTAKSIHGFVKNVARRRATPLDVEDRLRYLVSANYLATRVEHVPGEGSIVRYECTADGMDVLDNRKPWRE